MSTETDEAIKDETADGAAEEAQAPRDELREEQLAELTEALGDKLLGSHIDPGHELWVRVERDAWTEAAELAKVRLGCTFFDFLSGLDWLPSPWGRYEDAELDMAATPRPELGETGTDLETGHAGGAARFQVFARVANVRKHHSVILKADVPGGEPGSDEFRIDSLVRLYHGANWHERECWEMFGITFVGHPDLRHLYLPGAFEGNPLRKDFPLLARLVKPWPGVVDVEPMPEPSSPEDNGSGKVETQDDGDESGET